MNPLKPIALAAILHCSIAAGSTWTQTSGPEGGQVMSLAHDGAQFYAGVGGVQRSSDGASTWTAAIACGDRLIRRGAYLVFTSPDDKNPTQL